MKEKQKIKPKESNQSQDGNDKRNKIYDLEERTFIYTIKVNSYIEELPKTISNTENSKQLVRSSGSVGANYLEANESLSKKDFQMKIKICKKESKESRYWLRLSKPRDIHTNIKKELIQESTELMKIFASILKNSNKKRT